MFLEKDEGGYWCPDLSGCITFGETMEEATEMAKEAVNLLEACKRTRKKELGVGELMSKQVTLSINGINVTVRWNAGCGCGKDGGH